MRKCKITIYYPNFIAFICVWILLRWRKWKYGYPFRKIPLGNGKFAIIDPEDFGAISQYGWYANENGYTYYAARKARTGLRKRSIRMHRQIINAPFDKVVDHINRRGWDNRKANLRLASQQENAWNNDRGKNRGSSKYKGVHYNREQRKWKASLCHKGGKIHLGYFESEVDAAKAYDRAAKMFRGEFAVVNF